MELTNLRNSGFKPFILPVNIATTTHVLLMKDWVVGVERYQFFQCNYVINVTCLSQSFVFIFSQLTPVISHSFPEKRMYTMRFSSQLQIPHAIATPPVLVAASMHHPTPAPTNVASHGHRYQQVYIVFHKSRSLNSQPISKDSCFTVLLPIISYVCFRTLFRVRLEPGSLVC